MAVSTKTITTADHNSGRKGTPVRQVHYVKLHKGNRKGTSTLLGGHLLDHVGNRKDGDFSIMFWTTINRKPQQVRLHAGDVVFRTGSSDRWQVMTLKGFRRRFPEARI